MICDLKKGAGGEGRPGAAYLSSGLAVCQLSHATALSYSNQHMPLQLWANLHAELRNPLPHTAGAAPGHRARGPAATEHRPGQRDASARPRGGPGCPGQVTRGCGLTHASVGAGGLIKILCTLGYT